MGVTELACQAHLVHEHFLEPLVMYRVLEDTLVGNLYGDFIAGECVEGKIDIRGGTFTNQSLDLEFSDGCAVELFDDDYPSSIESGSCLNDSHASKNCWVLFGMGTRASER